MDQPTPTTEAPPPPPPAGHARLLARPPSAFQRAREWVIEFCLFLCGLLSIGVTLTIAAVLLYGTGQFFADTQHVSVPYFFFGTTWSAGFANPQYGILGLVV